MSITLRILKDSIVRQHTAGSTSDFIIDPVLLDPVTLKKGNNEKDSQDFNKKIVNRHKQMDFNGEPGHLNPTAKRLPSDPYSS